MTSETLFQNTVILRRPEVARFAGIIRIITRFVKKVFKDSKVKELQDMYQNAIYICISSHNKIC